MGITWQEGHVSEVCLDIPSERMVPLRCTTGLRLVEDRPEDARLVPTDEPGLTALGLRSPASTGCERTRRGPTNGIANCVRLPQTGDHHVVKGTKTSTVVWTGDATPYSNIHPRAGMALAGPPRSSHTDHTSAPP